ncbi:peptidase [Sphingobium sp. TomMM35A]
MVPARQFYRWLFLVHRWIGIGSCLLFCIWFLSGLVMLHIPYPSLSLKDRLTRAAPIEWWQVDQPPPPDMAGAARLDLLMRDSVPVWRAERPDGSWASAPARRGVSLTPVDGSFARRVAERFARLDAKRARPIERDQWTVAGGFNAHRPLWKVEMNDPARTVIYVSSATGEPVQRTTGSQRLWNWVGSVPHWIYPTLLRQHAQGWRQVVLWVSGPCIAAALSGIWVGLMRARIGQRRFPGGRMTPYRGWMLWHHIAGLAGGLFLLTWIFSGWLSVDPGSIFASKASDQTGQHYAAGAAPDSASLDRLRDRAPLAAMVRVQRNAGLATATILPASGPAETWLLASTRPAPLSTRTIIAAAASLVPEGRMTEAQLLRTADAYWYSVTGDVQLPVLQLRFGDIRHTWLYLDPRTGELLARMDERRRAYRWLFDMLHRWDVGLLIRNAPARVLLIWMGSLIGLVTSASGLVIGWRRLTRRKSMKVKSRPAKAAAALQVPV